MAESLKPETLTNNFYNRKRLVRQEMAKYYRISTEDRYKNAGVKKVQWHSMMDNRTCSECKKHNGEIMPVDKAPVNGWHIQCRC